MKLKQLTFHFLNVNIKYDNNRFSTQIYFQPTNTGLYMLWDSFLPHSYKINLIKCLLLRAFKICSNWSQFIHDSNQITNVFTKLDYPSDILEYIINSFKNNINTKPLVQYGPTKRKVFLKLQYISHLSKKGNLII